MIEWLVKCWSASVRRIAWLNGNFQTHQAVQGYRFMKIAGYQRLMKSSLPAVKNVPAWTLQVPCSSV